MKKQLVIAAALLLSITAISISAQTRPAGAAPATPNPSPAPPTTGVNVPNTKIALIDPSMFADEKTGIKRYVEAIKSAQLSLQVRTDEVVNLQNRLKVIADDITKLNSTPVVSPQTVQAKQSEGESLQRELKYKKEQLDADLERKYSEVVGPVSNLIAKALTDFASQYGLSMIFDITKLAPAVMSANPALDITRAFIADFNSKNP